MILLESLDDFLHECFGIEFLLILLAFCKFRIWKRVIQNGDTVIDATCGNGYDTLAMLKMVADESGRGRVYGIDIQGDALKSTASLLDESVTLKEVILSCI